MSDLERLERARQYYTQSQAETMELYGLNRSVGLLYGAMIFRNDAMTLEEMCQETGMSKTSMSTGVRELSQLQLVRKVFRPGIRKDLYEAERNQFASFIEYFTKLWRRATELNLRSIRQSETEIRQIINEADLDSDVRLQAQRDLAVLQGAKVYYNWLKQLTDAFEKGDISVPIPDDFGEHEGGSST